MKLHLFPAAALILTLSATVAVSQTPDARGRVIAASGTVEYSPRAAEVWERSRPLQELFLRDRLRTQAASRAAVLFFDETQVRLGPNALLAVEERERESGSVFTLLEGEGWFRTRRRDAHVEVRTPAATAAVRGTELDVRVDPDRKTIVTVLEGSVELFNDAGTVTLFAGEEGTARPGEAPVKRVVVEPDNAVQWVLYYPFVLSWADYETEMMSPAARCAFESFRRGEHDLTREGDFLHPREGATTASPADPWLRIVLSLASLMTGDYDAAGSVLDKETVAAGGAAEAELLVHRGIVQMARGLPGKAAASLELALARDPQNVRALSYRALILLVQNRREEAQDYAGRAVAADPDSFLANITAGEVRQAYFDLDGADRFYGRAAEIDAGHPRARVNLARIWFGRGEPERAGQELDHIAPGHAEDAPVVSLRGFLALTQGRQRAASELFRQAIAADPTLGEAHLGQGLVAFRDARPSDGLQAMLAATLVEPRISLYQSYLAKAYNEIGRVDEALLVVETAKKLDPRDPTPWLYESAFRQNRFQYAGALRAVEEAIARNDNRAVYRSRLLLDQDLSTRNLSLATAYRELGFNRRGTHEGQKSLHTDFANPSAHLFLAGLYLAEPDRLRAGTGELLQYLMLAPVNRNTYSSFKEYAVLFESSELVIAPGAFGGYPLRAEAELYTRSGNDVFAHNSLTTYEREEGARADQWDWNASTFFSGKLSLGRNSDLLLEAELAYSERGEDELTVVTVGYDTDQPVNLQTFTRSPDSTYETTSLTSDGILGVRYAFGLSSPLLVAAQYSVLDIASEDPDALSLVPGLLLDTRTARQHLLFGGQIQQAFKLLGEYPFVGGVEGFYREKTYRSSADVYSESDSSLRFPLDDEHKASDDYGVTGYGYQSMRLFDFLTLTGGIRLQVDHGEHVFAPQVYEYAVLSPSLGLTADLAPHTTARAAAFQRLNNRLFTATLSPTTLHGFLLDRNEFPYTRRTEVAAALEHPFDRLFAQNAFHARWIEYAPLDPSLLEEAIELELRSSLEILPADVLGLSLSNRALLFDTAPFTRIDDDLAAEIVLSLPSGFRFSVSNRLLMQWFPSTVHAGLGTGIVDLLDARLEYRFPGRSGNAYVSVSNILDQPIELYVDGLSVPGVYPFRRIELFGEVRF